MKYQLEMGSPVDFDKLVVYIIIDGIYIALLNQDKGIENLEIQFLDIGRIKEVDYLAFIESLAEAKKLLTSE
jgi:hypothetical protein